MPDRDDPFVVAPDERSTDISEPTVSPITYKGEEISSGLIMRLWRDGHRLNQVSRGKVLEARAYRRREESSLVKLAPTWARANPEAANWVVDVRPERTALEQDLIARVGSVEPEYVCEPLGFLDRDREYSEAKQAWLEEWRLQNVPTQAMFGKAVEDGPFAWTVLPAYLDREGMPTFFETLDERAYEELGEDDKKSYKEDDDSPNRKRYVKVDSKGKKRVRNEYDKGDTEKSKQAHKEAVARYLLRCQPVTVRLIPALDCAPILTRGTGRDRWKVASLVERQLFYPEELLEMGYGWPGLGDRLLVPMAYRADGEMLRLETDEIGRDSQFYLYTAYLVCKDDDGHERPVLAWTVGGTSTSYAPGSKGVEPDGDGEVGLIDFWEALKYTDEKGKTCSVEGPLWGVSGGMHSEDDDPDHYWRPAMHHVLPLIRQIEGNQTAMNAAITTVSFTGHVQRIDAALAAVEGVGDAAILEEDGSLRRFKTPRPGEIEPSTGPIEPFQQAQIGPDAWRKIAADQLSLQQTTAIDALPSGSGPSGAAQIVQLQTGQQAKRQIREGVKYALEGMGSCVLKILTAYAHKFDIGWPIQTTQERSIGDAVVKAKDLAEFDPRWVGEGNYLVACEYAEEENLARVDLENSLMATGVGNPERVWRALGETDFATEWAKALKWQIKMSPEYLAVAKMKYAQATGNADMVAVLKDLQAREEMTRAGVPGAKNGVPVAALPRGQGGTGRQSSVAQQRAGIEGGQIQGAQAAADAEAAFQNVGAT